METNLIENHDAQQVESDPDDVIRAVMSEEEFAALIPEEQGIVRRNFYNRELLLLAQQLARLRILMHARVVGDYWTDYLRVVRSNEELKELVRNMALTWLHTDTEALARISDYQERYNIGL